MVVPITVSQGADKIITKCLICSRMWLPLSSNHAIKMQRSSLIAMVLDAPSGNATMLLSCSQLVTERLDPLVNPGDPQTPHLHSSLHHVHFIEDISNYWTAVLYFKARNGTFKRVPQKGNVRFESANGGGQTLFHTAYGGSGKVNVTAFNPVFVCLSGIRCSHQRSSFS